MNNKNFVMSFSGGKDSTLALYRMINRGYNPVAILTTIKKNEDESWTHGLSDDMLQRVSKSLNIPLLKVECDVCEYEKRFEEVLKEAKSMGASICAYGDIDIEDHKKWGIDRCTNADLDYEFPLWQEDRESLVHEFIDSGFTTIIKKVNLSFMGEEFLGKKLTKDVVEDIKKTGSDPCGENGEYHTFVVDGPLFKSPIEFDVKKIVLDHGYGHLEIL
ncbi:diphthine--ammonia ligase [Romboutsia weinsteinii]|uniref:Diphthine--ammonia ligase n=1 Tax=Romboutsia weinsteinii TaxID=2020949 RepID=A0A371J9P9_9FIRM|nr:diphthine--ammonia ligase [Romboutsia weinsteinii]RDY29475.1 diphthine--ammonia ligase [Romboutsia weinsteinii]